MRNFLSSSMRYHSQFGRLYMALTLLTVMGLVGVVGFMLIEGYSLSEALFMTIITISTVGFGAVKPLSTGGMYFTTFIIITSFGIFAYVVSSITGYLVNGELVNFFKIRNVNKQLKHMKNHVIICGYGRNGRQAAQDLLAHDNVVIVIEAKEIHPEPQHEKHPNFIWMQGDATHDDTMERAKLSNAKALITTLPSDADNLFVVLSARNVSETLTIISRASDDHSDIKLKRVGANNVIMPDKVGGVRMARLVSQPDIVEFIETILAKSSDNIQLEEISCENLLPEYIGKSIGQIEIRQRYGANLIGIKREDSTYLYNPPPTTILNKDLKLFMLGTMQQIELLKVALFNTASTNDIK